MPRATITGSSGFIGSHLIKRLKQEGFTHTTANFIIKYEKTGQLKIRRNPLNGFRSFTKEEIDQIIQALKEQGKDFKWSYNE